MWKFSVIIAVILGLGLEQATACDCPRYSEAEQIAQADAIVVVDMTKFAATTSLMQSSCPDPIGTAEVAILETFKGGNMPKKLSVELSAYSGEEVHVGKYLMFLHREKSGGLWQGGIGSGECQTFGMRIESSRAVEMLSYLRSRPAKGQGGRVVGRVMRSGASVPREAVTVELANMSGKKISQAKLDEVFRFSIDRVPVGQYMVRAKVQEELGLSSTPRRISVSDREIVDVSINLSYDGAISGVLVDGAGQAYPESDIFLVHDEKTSQPIEGHTDEKGLFEFLGLSAGSYRLALARRLHHNRIDKPFSQWLPYYYPDANEYVNAAVLQVKKNQKLSNIRFSLPKNIVQVDLKGRVSGVVPTGEFGIAGVGALCTVSLGDGKTGFHNQPFYDGILPLPANGQFTMRILTGQKYVLYAHGSSHSMMFPSETQYESPMISVEAKAKQPIQLELKVKKSGETMEDFEKEDAIFSARADQLCGSER